MYDKGEGAQQNYTEAVKWFRKAAEQGHVKAQRMLGLRYATGKGVPKNYTEAVKWFRKAAEQGYSMAQFGLGSMYKQGWGGGQTDI